MKREQGIEPDLVKIPQNLWEQVVSFLLWSQKTFKQEALIHGFYNENPPEGQPFWIIEPPHQEPNGMTVNGTKEGEGFEENQQRQNELEAQGYILRFTAHHHCLAAASQSGTDKTDEHSKPTGFHITLGNLDERQLSFHSRLVIRLRAEFDGEVMLEPARTIQLDPPPWQFIETPLEDLIDENPWIIGSLKLYFLQRHDNIPFPPEWKETISVPIQAPHALSGAAKDCFWITQLKKGVMTDMFNAVLFQSGPERSKSFSGNGIPEGNLPWGKTKKSDRRQIYDAIHRVITFYESDKYVKVGKGKVYVTDILKAYYEQKNSVTTSVNVQYSTRAITHVIYYTGSFMGEAAASDYSHLPVSGNRKKLRAPKDAKEWLELYDLQRPSMTVAQFKEAWVAKWDFRIVDEPQQQTLQEQISEHEKLAQFYGGDY